MKLKRIIRQSVFTLGLFIAPVYWLACTNSGLNAVLTVAAYFAPIRVSYTTAHGTLIGPQIVIANVTVTDEDAKLCAKDVTINWRQRTFKIVQIKGFESFLPAQQYLALGAETQINLISGIVTYKDSVLDLDIGLRGNWRASKLNAKVVATYTNSKWLLHRAQLSIGKNITQLSSNAEQIEWGLQLAQPDIILKQGYGSLHAAGTITLGEIPKLNASINAKNFGFTDVAIKNLFVAVVAAYDEKAPVSIAATADKIVLQQHVVTQLKLLANGSLAKHQISFKTKSNNNLIEVKSNATFKDSIWKTNKLQLQYGTYALQGDADYNITKQQAALNLQGNPHDITSKLVLQMLKPNSFKAKLDLHANAQNYLHADISLHNQKLSGELDLIADDLSAVMQLIPDVTRLKGHLRGKASISGTIEEPKIKAAAHLTDITATLPGLGIKIKPMELHLRNDGMDKLILTGHGKMRRGSGDFKVSGYIMPFKPNMPNEIHVHGNNVEFINTSSARLIANNQLKISHDFATNVLTIRGHVDILRGNIYFDPKKTSTVKSKDVVFIDNGAQEKGSTIQVNPDLNIWIFEAVHFSGSGLSANISGNLDVTQRNNMLYGSGRVTIKEGTLKVPGQTLTINKGRLLYPVGTLLTNPTLDIKILDNKPGSKLEVVVRGTAQSPVIHEASMDTDKLLSQAMLAGGSMLSRNMLQDKLKLTEFGFADSNKGAEFNSDLSSYDNPSHSNPTRDKNSFRNKDLVIGRRLGNKVYLQYLQSMNSEDDNKRGRLKYLLNENWSVDLETGNKGSGADLSFSIERD